MAASGLSDAQLPKWRHESEPGTSYACWRLYKLLFRSFELLVATNCSPRLHTLPLWAKRAI